MKIKGYFKAFVTIALLTAPSVSFATFKKFLSRFELGYTYVMASGVYSGSFPVYDQSTGLFLPGNDVSASRSITAKTGFGEGIGTYFPLKRLGEKSSLVLSVNLNECGFIWGDINALYTSSGTFYNGSTDVYGETVQIGLPVGLDFKFGCDALSNKDSRFCATLGAGANTTMNGTVIGGGEGYTAGAGFNVGVNPYVKAEAGIFFGICWKVRCIFSFGNVPYISEKSTFAFGNLEVTGKTNTQVSLIVMPFSFMWKRTSWADPPEYY